MNILECLPAELSLRCVLPRARVTHVPGLDRSSGWIPLLRQCPCYPRTGRRSCSVSRVSSPWGPPRGCTALNPDKGQELVSFGLTEPMGAGEGQLCADPTGRSFPCVPLCPSASGKPSLLPSAPRPRLSSSHLQPSPWVTFKTPLTTLHVLVPTVRFGLLLSPLWGPRGKAGSSSCRPPPSWGPGGPQGEAELGRGHGAQASPVAQGENTCPLGSRPRRWSPGASAPLPSCQARAPGGTPNHTEACLGRPGHLGLGTHAPFCVVFPPHGDSGLQVAHPQGACAWSCGGSLGTAAVVMELFLGDRVVSSLLCSAVTWTPGLWTKMRLLKGKTR